MVAEGVVLLTVERLKKRGGGVAVRVSCELVYLVEKHQGVLDLSLSKSLNYSSGHRAYVCLAVSAYISLVSHAAKRDAHVLALHRSCDRRGYRGLAHTGRAYEAEYLIFKLGIELLYREVFKNSVLDLLESVVVCVKYLLCRLDVKSVLGGYLPRYLKAGVKIGARYGSLGRAEGGFGEAVCFLEKLLAHLVGALESIDLFSVIVAVVALAKLTLDDLELLAQVKFLLVLIESRADLLVYLHFTFKQLCFLTDERDKQLDALDGIEALKHLLLVGVLYEYVRGYEIREERGALYRSRGGEKIVADRREKPRQMLSLAEYRAAVCLRFDALLVRERDGFADKVSAYIVCEAVEFCHRRS